MGMGKAISYEIKTLCSNRVNSVLKSKDRLHLSKFPWTDVVNEIIEHCPLLFSLLFATTKTKAEKPSRLNFICAIVCMLAKFHNSNMSLLQRLITVILYAGHTGTAVCHILMA